MATQARLMTADEFLMMPDDGLLHELVRGEVVTMSLAGGLHGKITLKMGRLVGNHVDARRLGEAFAAETGFLIERDPDTVRGPDVGFVRAERLREITNPEKHVPFAPDLAVEVNSPNDTADQIEEKALEWLAAGSLLVWTVNPAARTVTVYRPGAKAVVLTENEELDGGEVLPGFKCRVAEIFT